MDLLQTKFHKPQIEKTHYCYREFLKNLDREERTPVWLLSAPAGYGKSSLLAQWIDQNNGSTAFLSLDSFDNDSRQFLSYFITAIKLISPDSGKGALSLLNSAKLPEIETCLISLINDLQDLTGHLTIILDDLHVIENREIFRGLDFFIDNLPGRIRLILSTREDPPISLGRLRAGRKLREIRQDDLRFSLDESSRFLRKNCTVDLSNEECSALYNRSEGWVTGLQLIVTALEQQKDRKAFIRQFSGNHYFIFDYLMEEVLSNLDQEMQSFLLETAIFSEFSASVCDEYLGSSTADIIRRTARANLFLIPLDSENRWFRFHHLFSGFLESRLIDSCSSSQLKEKFSRGFTILVKQNRFDDAFQLGIKGELWDDCVDILCRQIPSFCSEARLYDLDIYLKKLPEEKILNNADLFGVSRWYLMGNDRDDRVFTGEMNSFLEGVDEAVKGYALLGRGDTKASRRAFLKAYELISPQYGDIRDSCRLDAGAILRIEGKLIEAEEEFLFDLKPDRYERRFYSSLLQCINRVEVCRERGQLCLAEEVLEESFRLVEELSNHHGLISTGYLWVEKALIAYTENNLSGAYDYIRKGIRYCRVSDVGEYQILALLCKSQIEKALDMDDKVRQTLLDAKECLGDISPLLGQIIEARQAELKIKTGEDMGSWPDKCRQEWNELKRKGPFPTFLFIKYIVFCDYLIHSGNYKEADECLDYISHKLKEREQMIRYFAARIRKACISYRQEHRAEANRIMEEILELNGNEKNLRIFLDAGDECPYMLADADEKGLLPDFLKDYARPDSKRKKVLLEINNYEESFNDRELDIIKYMGQGFSNQEIGDTIYLSINTVRWYARQIFSKLDVKRRGEAVAKAKTLGLV